jgi:hypothetical protein
LTNLEDRGATAFEPRFPTAIAALFLSAWILLLSLPMWTGAFLGGQFSDQYHSGYAFRHWLAKQWSETGAIPLWNPEMFGGFPFVGAMHGDIFYPTSLLRLVLPTGFAMSLGFVVHYVLAGFFVYLLLRLLRVTWTGAVVGGFAYQLSGVIGSYVQPGHDGKLFVSTLLPVALIGLVLAMRDRRVWGFGIVAGAVGLALLSPHAQLTYYMLIAAGLFALYLAFGEVSDRSLAERLTSLGFALAAVVIGFGIGMIQLLPFFEYLPYSPRAEGYYGFEGSVSYAVPWSHVPELFLSGFVGTTPERTYWGANPLKLHSEYLGLTAVALAIVGALDRDRRRLVAWLLGIGALFLLVALGGATPFYRLWWSVMPFVKQTRAPGMALYVVALVVGLLAGVGVDRWLRERAAAWVRAWLIAGGAIAVLALLGAFGMLADFLAHGGAQGALRSGEALREARPAIARGAMASGLALLALGLIALLQRKGRVPAAALALTIPLVVSGDLWLNARGFWTYSEKPTDALFGGDEIIRTLQAAPLPYRVIDLSDTGADVYPGASLMAFGIPQVLGHHGNQLHHFNELLGGKNEWRYLLAGRRLWDLFAVQYVLIPTGLDLGSQLPAYSDLEQDFETLLSAVPTASGGVADLLIRRDPVPYARMVQAAVAVPDEEAIPNVADPRASLPTDRVVLLAPEAGVQPAPVTQIPEPLAVTARVTEWEPGSMTIHLEPAPNDAAYLLVSENYYPGWHAWVDGREGQVVRGDVSLVTVPVAAGSSEVRLEFTSDAYVRGRLITWLSAALAIGLIVVPIVSERRRRA